MSEMSRQGGFSKRYKGEVYLDWGFGFDMKSIK